MQIHTRPRDIVFTISAVLLVGLAIQYFRNRAAVNVHDPANRRIDAFAIQEGEYGVMVRVQFGGAAVAGAEVWADPRYNEEDEDTPDPPIRRDTADDRGLVSVPVRKNASGRVHLFARAGASLGGTTLDPEKVLTAPDIVIRPAVPREGRLLGADEQPLAGMRLITQGFSHASPDDENPAGEVEIPQPLSKDYTTTTDKDGQFRLPGVPKDAHCRFSFDIPGYGCGKIRLPATADADIRLAPAVGLMLRVEGDASAVRGMRCRVNAIPAIPFKPEAVSIDGSTKFRHSGSARTTLSNVVPGKYQIHLEGTAKHALLPTKAINGCVDEWGGVRCWGRRKREGGKA